MPKSLRRSTARLPRGQDYLVLGHENLGRVREAPEGSGLVEGDLVVGIVRRPDPEPCKARAAGEWYMCLNGKYTEHGIKGLDGFAREKWRAGPEAMVKLDPGLEDVGVLLWAPRTTASPSRIPDSSRTCWSSAPG